MTPGTVVLSGLRKWIVTGADSVLNANVALALKLSPSDWPKLAPTVISA